MGPSLAQGSLNFTANGTTARGLFRQESTQVAQLSA